MKKKKGFYIAVGLMTGLLIGVYLDNIGLWLSLGLVFGVSVENSKQSKNQETQGMKDSLSTSFRNNVDVLNGKRLYVYCVYVLYIVYCL